MRWIKFCGAVLAAMSMANLADAGFCGLTGGSGAAKSCGYAATTQPACCKPVIVRPCGPTVHTYQRRVSDIKPPCCDSCAPNGCSTAGHGNACGNGGNGSSSCAAPAASCLGGGLGGGNGAPTCAAPASNCNGAGNGAPTCAAPAANCVGGGMGVGNGAPTCAAPAANCVGAGNGAPTCAAPAANCVGGGLGAPTCAAPATNCVGGGLGAGNGAPTCAAPAANCGPAAGPACAAPAANYGPAATSCAPAATSCAPAAACGTKSCGNLLGGGFLKGLFAKPNCAAVADPSCGAPAASCTAVETRICNANPCDIAKLIYTSQTACYATQRRAALRKLGSRYDCICNPEIMSAFIYGLNDADERVRRTAADKIGDQIRKNSCCCPEVVAALTCALGDCDRSVRRQAEQALRLCGYDIVDGNCNTCSSIGGCGNNGCAPVGNVPTMIPSIEPATPAPLPPTEKTGPIHSAGVNRT